MYNDNSTSFFSHNTPFVQEWRNIGERRKVYKTIEASGEKPDKYSSTPLAGINAADNFEKAFTKETSETSSTPETLPTLPEMKKVAESIMHNFYTQTNPDASENDIKTYISTFHAVIDAKIPNSNELLPQEKQKEYYETYMDTLKNFNDLQDESIRKNGVMSVDGFMLGNNRVEHFSLSKPFVAKLKTPSDPVAYLKNPKNKTKVPFPNKFSRTKYPNLTILELEGINPLIFTTGIVEIKETTFHDDIIGLQILDGDGHFHLYDARTKEMKAIIAHDTGDNRDIRDKAKNGKKAYKKPKTVEKPTPSRTKSSPATMKILRSKDNLYEKLKSTHYSLFKTVTNTINEHITKSLTDNTSAEFDWSDWGNTPFEVNKTGDIILDKNDWKNESDIIILTAQEAQEINKKTKLGNAQSLVDILNQYKSLLDKDIIDKVKTSSLKKSSYKKPKEKTENSKITQLSNNKKQALYKKKGITEKINTTKGTTTLTYKGVTFTYLNTVNQQRNTSKKFITENIKLLTSLGEKYNGEKNKKIIITEKKENKTGKNKKILLMVQHEESIYATQIDKNKNPTYKKVIDKKKSWGNVNTNEKNFLEKNITPFYKNLKTFGNKTNKEQETKIDNIVQLPVEVVEERENSLKKLNNLYPSQIIKMYKNAGISVEKNTTKNKITLKKGGVTMIYPISSSVIQQELTRKNITLATATKASINIIKYFSKIYTKNNPIVFTNIENNKSITSSIKYNNTILEIKDIKSKDLPIIAKEQRELRKFINNYHGTINSKEFIATITQKFPIFISFQKKMRVYNVNRKKDLSEEEKSDFIQKIAPHLQMFYAYNAKNDTAIAKMIIQEEMADKNSKDPPSLGKTETLIISPKDNEYKVLKTLFGNFKTFNQYIQYVNNARWGALTFGDSIYIGDSEDLLDKKSILFNELVHGIIENQYQYFSAKPEESWIKNIKNIQINEFLSDVASITIDPIKSFNILNDFGKDDDYLQNRPNYQYTIEFFKNSLEKLKQEYPNKTDEFYANEMVNIYMKQGQEFVKMIKEREKREKRAVKEN